MIYNPGMLRKLLADYQRRAQGARMRPPDDVLVSRPPPLEEAPWANTSCLWSDIEQAMRALPFQHEKILWMTVCLGESSWAHVENGKNGANGKKQKKRNDISRYNWREKVGDYWGITGGDVNRIVKDAIQEMTDSLNGVAVTNG
jgi:hypothetical protein